MGTSKSKERPCRALRTRAGASYSSLSTFTTEPCTGGLRLSHECPGYFIKVSVFPAAQVSVTYHLSLLSLMLSDASPV